MTFYQIYQTSVEDTTISNELYTSLSDTKALKFLKNQLNEARSSSNMTIIKEELYKFVVVISNREDDTIDEWTFGMRAAKFTFQTFKCWLGTVFAHIGELFIPQKKV